MVGEVLLALLICLLQNGFTFCSGTNYTITFSIEPNAEREYFYYFSNSKEQSPLKKYLYSPRKVYAISKAAEFSVGHYSNTCAPTHRSVYLRKILSIQDHNNVYKIRTLLKDEKTGKLIDKGFQIYINELRDGRFRIQSEIIKDKRAVLEPNQNTTCDKLSTIAKCSTCGYNGICHKGTAHLPPWLSFALKTQRALQVNMTLDKVQMLAAHNAFNDRSDGYGIADDCLWPPPYKTKCIDLANQEFSFTDQLNMGVRALEIDPWWCFGKIRMSHAHDYAYLGCGPWDREFKDGIKEIADWKKRVENRDEIVRLYLEDGESHTRSHDDLVNGPIEEHFGDVVLTPRDLDVHFSGKWPTPFEMQRLGKTIIISTANNYNHQGKFIHKGYWTEMTINKFHSFPNCAAVKQFRGPVRVYSDSTKYGPFWNGPTRTGTITNYLDYLKCGVIYPAADQVNPQLISTSVFTWAVDEPQVRLTRDSCVALSANDKRWHIEKCSSQKSFACKNTKTDKWLISSNRAVYSSPQCPDGYRFSIPRNAHEQYQLLDAFDNQDAWINFTEYLPLLVDH